MSDSGVGSDICWSPLAVKDLSIRVHASLLLDSDSILNFIYVTEFADHQN